MLKYLVAIPYLTTMLFCLEANNLYTQSKKILIKKQSKHLTKKPKIKLPQEVLLSLQFSEKDQSVYAFNNLLHNFNNPLLVALMTIISAQFQYAGETNAYTLYSKDYEYYWDKVYEYTIRHDAGLHYQRFPTIFATIIFNFNLVHILYEYNASRTLRHYVAENGRIKKLEVAIQNLELARRIVFDRRAIQDLEKAKTLLTEILDSNQDLCNLLEGTGEASGKDIAQLLSHILRSLNEHQTRLIESEVLLRRSIGKSRAQLLINSIDSDLFNINLDAIQLKKLNKNAVFNTLLKNHSQFIGAKMSMQEHINHLQKSIFGELFPVIQCSFRLKNNQTLVRNSDPSLYHVFGTIDISAQNKFSEHLSGQMMSQQKQILEYGQRYLEQRLAAYNYAAKIIASIEYCDQTTINQKLKLLNYVNTQLKIQESYAGYTVAYYTANLLQQKVEIENSIAELISSYYKALILLYSLYGR